MSNPGLPIHWRSEYDFSISVTITPDGKRMLLRAEKRCYGMFREEVFDVDNNGIGRVAARLRHLADWLDVNHRD